MESLVEWLEIKQRITNRDAAFGVMPDRRYGQAADRITATEAELAAMKARGDRLANFAEAVAEFGSASMRELARQALTEWRDQ